MATPPSRTPQAPLHHIKSAARKLPVKRKSPTLSSPAPPENPSAAADPPGHNRPSQSFSIIVDDGEGYGGSVYAADDYDPAGDESDGDGGDTAFGAMVEYDAGAGATAGGGAVPFKFQRIWSEADEVRFLRELLACHSQGMVFPRDLNVFFDRFSKTMTQPYTRSQLYEKLRRLRKKFRIASARIARGLNPAAMSLHDRELFDLSTKLWNPSFADSSPFVSSGPEASKRRRRLPLPADQSRHVSAVPVAVTKSPAAIHVFSSSPHLPPSSSPATDGNASADRKSSETLEKPLLATKDASFGGSLKHKVVNVVLDVFDRCLKEVQTASDQGSSLEPDHKLSPVSGEDLVKRWKEQRVLELKALSSRLRLVMDNAVAQE